MEKVINVAEYVSYTIDRLPKGYVFTYTDFDVDVNRKEAVIKALNRLVASGKIMKISKGRFYKSETTPFGIIQPNQYQVVKDLLEENGKTIGYLTGLSVYNDLGLTTQVSNTIQIGANDTRSKLTRGIYSISFIKQKNNITKDNIPFLQLLDSIRYIKRIPDTNPAQACKRLLAIINELSEHDINILIKLSMKYPPVSRALLGALLDSASSYYSTEILYKSLNPITIYKLPGISEVLLTEKWNIK